MRTTAGHEIAASEIFLGDRREEDPGGGLGDEDSSDDDHGDWDRQEEYFRAHFGGGLGDLLISCRVDEADRLYTKAQKADRLYHDAFMKADRLYHDALMQKTVL